MATNPLGGTFDHHVGAMLDGSQQSTTGTQGVVNDQGNLVLLGEGREGFKIRDIEARIAHRFDIDRLGVGIDLSGEALHRIALSEFHLNAQARELHLELVVGAPVEIRRRDKVVSRLHAIGDRQELG